MVNLLWYFLFLLMYAVAASGFAGVLAKLKRTAQTPFWLTEASQLLTAGLLYLTMLLLARYSSLLIFGSYLLSAQVFIVLDAALNATEVGQEKGRYQAEVRWAAECFALSNALLNIVIGLVGVIVFLAFPVLAGIAYFSNTVPSEAATVTIIRVTLLTLFVGGVVLMLPTQVSVPLSENLSAPVRRRFFFSLSASLLPNGLLLAILLSTFNISESKAARSSASFHLTYSPLMLIILAVYFVTTLLGPTVLGSMRSARWHRQLVGQQEQAWARAVEILRTPSVAAYTNDLSSLIDELQEARETLVKSDKGVAFGLRLDELKKQQEQSKVPATATSIAQPIIVAGESGQDAGAGEAGLGEATAQQEAGLVGKPSSDILNAPYYQALRKNFEDGNYYLARRNDPRFVYIDGLDSLIKKLHATMGDLQSKRSGQARLKAGREWAENYEAERKDLVATASAAKASTLGAVAISTVLTSLLTVSFTGLGNWLWTYMAHTLPK